MSNRFHNKIHRQNHWSWHDPSQPDSGRDPIASAASPFRGEFYLSGGALSAHNLGEEYAAIFDNNILVKNRIDAQNIHVTNTLTADTIEVNYIDIKYYETSGFMISGNDYRKEVPAVWTLYDTLTLNGIGLSTTSWANIGGDLYVGGDINVSAVSVDVLSGGELYATGCVHTDCIRAFSADEITIHDNILMNNTDISGRDIYLDGCLYTDCIHANTGDRINIRDHIDMNNNNIYNTNIVQSNTVSAVNIYATNYFGLTTDNLSVTVNEGWKRLDVANTFSDTINTFITNHAVILERSDFVFSAESDNLITVRVGSLDYTSYGEIEGVLFDGATEYTVALVRVGNIGLLPHANVDHALQDGLFIDNEQTFTFIAPSGQNWAIRSLSGYGDVDVNVSVLESNSRAFSFAGDTLTMDNLVAQNISSSCGNDKEWCSVYTTVSTLSSIWDSTPFDVAVSTPSGIVDSVAVNAGDALFYRLKVVSGINMYAGNIVAITDGTNVNYTFNTTTEFGVVSAIDLDVYIDSGNMTLAAYATGNWSITGKREII